MTAWLAQPLIEVTERSWPVPGDTPTGSSNRRDTARSTRPIVRGPVCLKVAVVPGPPVAESPPRPVAPLEPAQAPVRPEPPTPPQVRPSSAAELRGRALLARHSARGSELQAVPQPPARERVPEPGQGRQPVPREWVRERVPSERLRAPAQAVGAPPSAGEASHGLWLPARASDRFGRRAQ